MRNANASPHPTMVMLIVFIYLTIYSVYLNYCFSYQVQFKQGVKIATPIIVIVQGYLSIIPIAKCNMLQLCTSDNR